MITAPDLCGQAGKLQPSPGSLGPTSTFRFLLLLVDLRGCLPLCPWVGAPSRGDWWTGRSPALHMRPVGLARTVKEFGESIHDSSVPLMHRTTRLILVEVTTDLNHH